MQRSKGSTISVISAHPLRSTHCDLSIPLPCLRFGRKNAFLDVVHARTAPHLGSAFYKKQASQAGFLFPVVLLLALPPCPIPRSPKLEPPSLPQLHLRHLRFCFHSPSLSASSRYRSEMGEGDITSGGTHGGHGHGRRALACSSAATDDARTIFVCNIRTPSLFIRVARNICI